MKKIFVTGGAGFIGSHLVKRLVEDGNEVVVADILLRGNKLDPEILKAVHFEQADVRDIDAMRRLSKRCDQIFHFAAILGVDVVADNPVETMETECIGMQNVAKVAIEIGAEKVIYASTSGVYGHSAIEKSVTENIQLDPRTSYAIAKRYNEIYLAALFEEKGLNSISLRFFNVYGEKQDTRMVIPRFIDQALRHRPITVFGDGQQTRDFTFIDDTVEAVIRLAGKVKGSEIFNIANEDEISIRELAEEIKSLTLSNSEITFIKAPQKRYDFEIERRLGSSQKLFEAVNYKPTTSIQAGLQSLLMLTEGATQSS
ncbi:MAG: SDR family NAD(P)-dependent oxidoreductase [Flavobacteriales bacterium]|nr:SDR family NAD(P)-dependent oxidoreductase [Flavobacteriales bacterium]MCB9448872.1 SDR family NAD(P)-dependent oxidoreductase [Flavobacteriales bacterium]